MTETSSVPATEPSSYRTIVRTDNVIVVRMDNGNVVRRGDGTIVRTNNGSSSYKRRNYRLHVRWFRRLYGRRLCHALHILFILKTCYFALLNCLTVNVILVNCSIKKRNLWNVNFVSRVGQPGMPRGSSFTLGQIHGRPWRR